VLASVEAGHPIPWAVTLTVDAIANGAWRFNILGSSDFEANLVPTRTVEGLTIAARNLTVSWVDNNTAGASYIAGATVAPFAPDPESQRSQ